MSVPKPIIVPLKKGTEGHSILSTVAYLKGRLPDDISTNDIFKQFVCQYEGGDDENEIAYWEGGLNFLQSNTPENIQSKPVFIFNQQRPWSAVAECFSNSLYEYLSFRKDVEPVIGWEVMPCGVNVLHAVPHAWNYNKITKESYDTVSFRTDEYKGKRVVAGIPLYTGAKAIHWLMARQKHIKHKPLVSTWGSYLLIRAPDNKRFIAIKEYGMIDPDTHEDTRKLTNIEILNYAH